MLKCQAARLCLAKDYRLFQTQSFRFKKDFWDDCENDGTETVVMLWDDWNGYRGEGVMVKKTAVLCKGCADKFMKMREERRCQNPKRPDCLMLAIECEEGMKEFGAALKTYGPRLCFRCVTEYEPPKSKYPVCNPKKKNDPDYLEQRSQHNWGTKTYAPLRPPEGPDTDDEEEMKKPIPIAGPGSVLGGETHIRISGDKYDPRLTGDML